MFKMPYETTPGSSYVQKDITLALTRAAINSELITAETLKGNYIEGLYVVPPYLKDIPPFAHPIAFERNGQAVYAIDGRNFMRQLREGGNKIVASTEYQFLLVRALLTMAWARGDVNTFVTAGELAPSVYIRFLAEGIVRRLGLQPTEQMAISIVTGFFFFCLFEDVETLSERELLKIGTRIARATFIPLEKILPVIEALPKLNNVDDYLAGLSAAVDSQRVQTLTVGLLYSIIGGSWFGASSREIVAVAVEHIPTFYAMLYMSLTDRSYHSAYFTKTVDSVNKSTRGKDFVNNLTALMGNIANV